MSRFREVYSHLYNSWGSEEDMMGVKMKVSTLIHSENSLAEVMKVTGQVVKRAAMRMKPAKADVSGGFTS